MELSVKKSRQGRANLRQINTMIDYMEKHPHVARNKFTTLHGKDNIKWSWNTMADHLNSLSNDTKVKDVKSWKTTWRDYKTEVSEKVRKLRSNRAQTGNKAIDIILNDLDKRVLGIISHQYASGVDPCPNAFPEEHL
ncbi:uncharacterized protein LOC105694323 [Orussus abietinus]|uniref:uncharacterized protein LOC105694323 n=1 Tax=Orussus abietinus TaxID=222816 RepID=UPI000C715EC0|nr:uncharacterized protein LOC105694323 [Orussus abietinus]